MKIIQKLEIIFGLITLISALFNFLFSVLPSMKNVTDTSPEIYLFWSLFFLVLPELLVAIGAYTHAVKQSRIGLIVLLIFGISLILFYGLLTLTGIAFYTAKSPLVVLAGLSPALFALATIVFALYPTLLPPPQAEIAKLR